MKISINWLKKFTAVDLSVDDLVAKIGAQLGAVEEVIDWRGKYKGIQVVQIIEAKPHPNADKLNIYQMTDGREQVQVVSGDRNLSIGDKVAWLAPGRTIPNTHGTSYPVVMEAREMRGQMSHGMFGSGRELDLNDDHEGVLKLDTDAAPGTLLSEAYELDDVIIDIENKMFTHRPDCFGIVGVAREIAGIQGHAFASPDWYFLEASKALKPSAEQLSLTVKNEIPMLCPTYRVAVLRNVTIGPSPVLLQSYLKRVGIRPINNVVDVTNYLMYITGQPLHAFDYNKVAAVDGTESPAIVVRLPHKDEQLMLLDGRTIKPHAGAILICSRNKPIALGGVMGGAETEVDAGTTTIILESANFDMYSIRRTSMEHGIFTDAVTRFSKGQSKEQCSVVLGEAVAMLQTHVGAQLATEIGIEAPRPALPIKTDTSFINERLGSQFHAADIKKLLTNVEMDVHVHGEQLVVTPPFWRTDVEIPEDLVEEVGRLYGYGSLPHQLPMRTTEAVDNSSIEALKSSITTILSSAGNNELQTYSFVSSKLFERSGQETRPAYRLRNALSPELELIRTSLLPSLLEKIHANHKAGYDQFGLFEIGKSHNKHDIGDDQLPRERLGLSFVFSAQRKLAEAYGGAPYYQVKYNLDHLLNKLHVPHVTYVLLSEAKLPSWWLQNLAKLFEPKRAALVLAGVVPIGIIGEFSSKVAKSFKLPPFAGGFELELGVLHGIQRAITTYQPLLRFPATDQDVCFRVAKEINYSDLRQLIEQRFVNDERLRVTVEPVDIYERPDDKQHKQITYRITLQHHDRTLTTDEVNQMIERLVNEATHKFKAERV